MKNADQRRVWAIGRPSETQRPWQRRESGRGAPQATGCRARKGEGDHMIARLTRVRALSLAAAFFAFVGGMVGVGSTTARAAGPTCNVQWSVQSDWGQGFSVNVNITNLGPAINGWTLQFTFPSGQQIPAGGGWGGTWSQSGNKVTVKDAGWNANL